MIITLSCDLEKIMAPASQNDVNDERISMTCGNFRDNTLAQFIEHLVGALMKSDICEYNKIIFLLRCFLSLGGGENAMRKIQ